jgi:hypothetical protein
MIRRLIEADIYNAPDNPPDEDVYFWFAECRTPELLISLAVKFPEIAGRMSKRRPLLSYAKEGNQDEVRNLLRDEEEGEREADRRYWAPLRKQSEEWRLKREP